jgi:flagellar basal body-associated protein FliL
MNTRSLKISLILLALLFAVQGCSFYARFGSQGQTPQATTKITENNPGQEKVTLDPIKVTKLLSIEVET